MNHQELIQKETENLLKLLDITAKVTVEEQEGVYLVVFDSDENALLIGKHGNTLSSLESILSLIVAKKLGEFVRISLEIGNYRQEREEYLKNLATRLKDDVIATGMDKTVRGLKPWERRLVHIFLQEDGDVMTQSEGEGRDRVLIIKKK